MLIPHNGLNICYDLLGPDTAETVVFSHSLAADMGMWAEQVPPLLAAGYRVLRVDLRGHGGSTNKQGSCTIDDLADDIVAVMDALQIARCHFVGLSIGGMVGQSLALRHGARIKSLMLSDTQTQSPADAATFWSPMIAAINEAGSMEAIADRTMKRWLTDDYKSANLNRWMQIRQTIAACTNDGYIACAGAIADFHFTERLRSVSIPAFVTWGTDDPRAMPGEGEHIASLFQNGSFEKFEGAKHLPNVEQPDAFNRAMLGWLAAQ